MEQMLAVIFENENKAHHAKTALRELVLSGRMTVYGGALIMKHADGTVSVRDFDDFGYGTAVGSLIVLLGTPKGLLTGSRSFAIRAPFEVDDLDNARVASDFIDEVSAALTTGRFAILAEIDDEDWPEPVDTQMKSAGGIVFRCPLRPARQETYDARIGVMKEVLAQLRREAAADGGSPAPLQMRMEMVQSRIDALQRRADAHRQLLEARHHAKRHRLHKAI